MPTARRCHGECRVTADTAVSARGVVMYVLADDPGVLCEVDAQGGAVRLRTLPALDWDAGEPLAGAAGRGQVRVVHTDLGEAVVRHYRRGGWMARLRGDRYRYRTPETTRCFAEFRLLRHLQLQSLPVCVPLAARYQRCGWGSYRADLATLRIPGARSLHQCLQQFPQQASISGMMEAVGIVIGRCHAAGLWHSDLNAHNLLRDQDGRWWLIDLDRSELRVPDADWPRQNLLRLRRSLLKLGHGSAAITDTDPAWQRLCAAHAEALARSGEPVA